MVRRSWLIVRGREAVRSWGASIRDQEMCELGNVLLVHVVRVLLGVRERYTGLGAMADTVVGSTGDFLANWWIFQHPGEGIRGTRYKQGTIGNAIMIAQDDHQERPGIRLDPQGCRS